ncbi:MAG: MotA/TolQ/ExbB proton channel family protein [Deltaproteobacteria bacterium]|jgi:biopolymer transport protein TolQ|nr:MotA/TolQ/ExbB proton channel family protein [Deltaproteobacteria bacterium]
MALWSLAPLASVGSPPGLVHLAAVAADTKTDVFGQVFESRGVVLAVLLVLIALSVICWFIIGLKTFAIARATGNTRRFIQTFRSATRLAELYQVSQTMPVSPARDMFRAGYEELDLILREREGRAARPRGDGPAAAPESASAAFENIERSLNQAAQLATSRLEKSVGFLATVGSSGPFIGLFGTVWGIMNAFGDIDPNLPILQTVTPHIAEALVATAIGLLAAIPAVMAYNFLVGRMKQLEIHLDDFSTDYLNILRRHFFS